MSVYAIALITIFDRERYGQYEAGFMAVFERFGGRLLAVDEAPEVLEGDWPATRTVILEFPDRASLDAWYGSEDYRALLTHRLAASTGSVAVVRALDAPSQS